MGKIQDYLKSLWAELTAPTPKQEMISPLASPSPSPTPDPFLAMGYTQTGPNSYEVPSSPRPTPSSSPKNKQYSSPSPSTISGEYGVPNGFIGPIIPYKNPMVTQWLNSPNRPRLKKDEMLSGTDIATREYGILPGLIMDIMGLESQVGMWDKPFENYPGQYGDEYKNARGPAMFLGATAAGLGIDPEDRYSATESARAVAKALNQGRLGEWDVVDKPGAGGGRLTDFYNKELGGKEALDYYSRNSNKRREMLKSLAQALGYE